MTWDLFLAVSILCNSIVRLCGVSLCLLPLSSRLCGKVPFYDTSVVKLNEIICAGKLEFSEPQWAGISEAGTPHLVLVA